LQGEPNMAILRNNPIKRGNNNENNYGLLFVPVN